MDLGCISLSQQLVWVQTMGGAMTKKSYRIIFEGKTLPGTTIEDVKKKLRPAFKASSDRFDRLFARLPVVLAKDVPYETAVKYKRLLEKA